MFCERTTPIDESANAAAIRARFHAKRVESPTTVTTFTLIDGNGKLIVRAQSPETLALLAASGELFAQNAPTDELPFFGRDREFRIEAPIDEPIFVNFVDFDGAFERVREQASKPTARFLSLVRVATLTADQ